MGSVHKLPVLQSTWLTTVDILRLVIYACVTCEMGVEGCDEEMPG